MASGEFGFRLLYGLVIVRLDRRDLIWINVTTNPMAEWVARQIRSLADFIATTFGFKFSVHTGNLRFVGYFYFTGNIKCSYGLPGHMT